MLERRSQTTIFHLCTGECGLRKHNKRLSLADSAHCECGSKEQTSKHILQTCQLSETTRQGFWQTCPHSETTCQGFRPTDTDLGTELWGPVDQLNLMAHFLAATEIKIQHGLYTKHRRRRIPHFLRCLFSLASLQRQMRTEEVKPHS